VSQEIEAIFSILSIFGHNYIQKSSRHLQLTMTIFIKPDLIIMSNALHMWVYNAH